MTKLAFEDKKEIIRLYEENEMMVSTLAKKWDVSVSTINRVIRNYEEHGEESLTDKKYTYYSPESKLEMINRVYAGESINSVAVEYGIYDTMLRNWLTKYEEKGYDGLINQKKGRRPKMSKDKDVVVEQSNADETYTVDGKSVKDMSVDELVATIKDQNKIIQRLKCEAAASKKLRALVQKRNQLQTGKKHG